MKPTLSIGTATAEPGKLGTGKIICESLADGAETFIAVTIVNGARGGPILWIGSTIHGREIPGIEVARRVTRDLIDPTELSGAVVCAMPLNPYGFRMQQHNVPQDGGNVNAKFPGNAQGTLSERLAEVIWREGVDHCDYVIDFHSNLPGGMEFMCATTCEDGSIQKKTIEMAEAFGFPLVRITRDMWDYDRSLIAHAMDAGKPAILPEPLAQGILQEDSIQASVRGVLNVMKCLGMIEGEIEPQTTLKVAGGHHVFKDLRTRKAGLALYLVDGGDWVEKGEDLVVIRDPWGNELDRVTSPTDAYVRSFVPYSIVNPGQIIGTLLEPHDREDLWGS